jgi:hypothetical protein
MPITLSSRAARMAAPALIATNVVCGGALAGDASATLDLAYGMESLGNGARFSPFPELALTSPIGSACVFKLAGDVVNVDGNGLSSWSDRGLQLDEVSLACTQSWLPVGTTTIKAGVLGDYVPAFLYITHPESLYAEEPAFTAAGLFEQTGISLTQVVETNFGRFTLATQISRYLPPLYDVIGQPSYEAPRGGLTDSSIPSFALSAVWEQKMGDVILKAGAEFVRAEDSGKSPDKHVTDLFAGAVYALNPATTLGLSAAHIMVKHGDFTTLDVGQVYVNTDLGLAFSPNLKGFSTSFSAAVNCTGGTTNDDCEPSVQAGIKYTDPSGWFVRGAVGRTDYTGDGWRTDSYVGIGYSVKLNP